MSNPKIYKGKIPFDKNGNQLSWADGSPEYPCKYSGESWHDNFEFSDALTFSSSYRGRSAANFRFKRSGGTTVSFFLGDFEDAIPHMNGGEIRGLFTFRKQGANFGCRLIKPN